MRIRELSILDREAVPAVLEALHTAGVLMLQMPAVFVLLAPATRLGIERLNQAKLRLPMKNYGTAIGNLNRFHAMSQPGSLPPELGTPNQMHCLTGAFIRFAVQAPHFQSPVIQGGTHQGLLVDGPHRALFRAIEREFQNEPDTGFFGGHRYTAPLCTSANLSGDPLGSITDWERAFEFAKQRQLPLIIRCEETEGEAGSYPIFYFKGNRATIERHGPGEREIMERLPGRLFSEAKALENEQVSAYEKPNGFT
jgi:hypothetical protein